VDVMRYLLSSGIVPHSHALPRSHSDAAYREYTPMQLAVTFGHRALVNLLRESGAGLKSSHLVDALAGRNGPVFLMVRHLIESGCAVNWKVAEDAKKSAQLLLSVASDHFHSSDWVSTIVLIAWELQGWPGDSSARAKISNVKKVMKDVTSGLIKAPKAPLEFFQIARAYVWCSEDDMD
jgi:hypothetical protein